MSQKPTLPAADVPLNDSQMETLSGGGYGPRHMSPEGREFARKISDVVAWPFRQVKGFVTGLFN